MLTRHTLAATLMSALTLGVLASSSALFSGPADSPVVDAQHAPQAGDGGHLAQAICQGGCDVHSMLSALSTRLP